MGAPERFQLLCYNGLAVGPTIRVRRGSTIKIRLKNDLPPGTPNIPPDDPSKYPASPQAEMPHLLCRTNLHTHGLHVSPADPADNIYRCLDPGEEYSFEYTIPRDHPSGTFWYHPHNHGSVAYQLANGVAGALIVEGSVNDDIHDLEDVPEIAAAKERILLFQLYNYRVRKDQQGRIAADAPGWIDANTIYNIQSDSLRCGAIKLAPQDADIRNTVAFQATAINGQINPTITIAPGEVQRWRLIHASWDLERNLTIVDDHDNPTDDLSFHEIALDGLATGTLAKKRYIDIAPGQRSDVLITASTDALSPDIPERVYHLKQAAVPANAAPHGTPHDTMYLAKIVVIVKARSMKLPRPEDLAKCRPFTDIRDAEISSSVVSKRRFEFAASDGNPDTPPDPPPPFYTINDKTFHAQDPLKLLLGTAEEWTLVAKKISHPFHIHVNAFQVVYYTDPEGNETPMNVWRDTLYIKEGETYRIRSRFRDFPGKTVFHCHVLDHEDQGMMMPIEFSNKGQPLPPQVICNDLKRIAPKLQTSAYPAPPLRFPDARGKVRDLSEFRGRIVLLVFFQGTDCAHCVEQLRALVRDARASISADVEIVAVSGRQITDPEQTLQKLDVTATDRFYLLSDGRHRAFRDFGCYADGPQHGLFVVDRDGVVRARYTGDTPFDDTGEAVRRVRALAGSSRGTVPR